MTVGEIATIASQIPELSFHIMHKVGNPDLEERTVWQVTMPSSSIMPVHSLPPYHVWADALLSLHCMSLLASSMIRLYQKSMILDILDLASDAQPSEVIA